MTPAPHPNSSDFPERLEHRTGFVCDQPSRQSGPTAKAGYFFKLGWTAQIRLKRFNKFGFTRKRRRPDFAATNQRLA
jgi:hypothetical protein